MIKPPSKMVNRGARGAATVARTGQAARVTRGGAAVTGTGQAVRVAQGASAVTGTGQAARVAQGASAVAGTGQAARVARGGAALSGGGPVRSMPPRGRAFSPGKPSFSSFRPGMHRPPPKAPGLFANHGKKIAAGLAAGAMGGAIMSRTGKAVDSQTGLPKGIYNY